MPGGTKPPGAGGFLGDWLPLLMLLGKMTRLICSTDILYGSSATDFTNLAVTVEPATADPITTLPVPKSVAFKNPSRPSQTPLVWKRVVIIDVLLGKVWNLSTS